MGSFAPATPWPRPSVSHRSTQIDTDDFCPADLAEVTGKQHKNVMQAIRNMESAWEKVNGGNFSRVEYKDAKGGASPLLWTDQDWVSLQQISQIFLDDHG